MRDLFNKKRVVLSILFGAFFALLLEGILAINRVILNVPDLPAGISGLQTLFMGISRRELVVLFLVFGLAFLFCSRYASKVVPFVYKYRYCFAAVFVILCVAFALSGSSIAIWETILGQLPSGENGVLFGTPRGIRSDEFNANTLMAFSQRYNQTGAFSYFGSTFRGAETDMFIVYGQPVLDFAEIFRPFHWGYLLFDPARGLAFFWSLRFAALFMVTFEMGMLITKGNKRLSLALSLLLSLAPVVQWWFAVNGFVEMLIYVQLAILLIHHYLYTDKTWQRVVCAVLVAWCAVAFILLFYPAWQVPMVYVLIALIVWLALEGRKCVKLTWKRDLPLLLLAVVLLAGSLAYVLLKSGGTIEAVMSTAYPGTRNETGGGVFKYLFAYPMNLVTPVKDPIPFLLNAVELSRFFDFFPMGLVMALWVLVVEKQRDKLLYCLLVLDALLIVYCSLGVPEWLAKITLLGQSPSGRTLVIVGLVNIFILIRCMAVIKTRIKVVWAVVLAVVLTAVVVLVCRGLAPDYFSTIHLLVMAVVLFLGFFFIARARARLFQNLFLILCVAIGLVAGGLVNPIQQGADVLYENPLVKEISAITHEDEGEGLWIVEGEGILVGFPAVVGAPTINTVNVYPNMERWHILDPEGEYEEVYNRYAHIMIELTGGGTWFELTNADAFKLHLNYDDIEKLNIRYIITRNEFSSQVGDVSFEKLANESGFNIYKTDYTGEG